MFAIALANTKHRQRKHQEKSTVDPEQKAGNRSRPVSSQSQKLLESLALIKILAPQILDFLNRAEASISTVRLQTRMAEACDSVSSILRLSTHLPGSKGLPDSIELFDILWDTLNLGIGFDTPESAAVDLSARKAFQTHIRRYRSDVVFILTLQMSNAPIVICEIKSEQRKLSYSEIQNERSQIITRVAYIDEPSCNACISAICKALKEASFHRSMSSTPPFQKLPI